MQSIRIRVAGILIHEDRILLVRHEKRGKSYYLLPGGGVEQGETVGEALIREFQEEVGLEIKIGKLVLAQDSIPPDLHRQVLNLYFTITTKNYDLKVTPDAVLRDAAFYPLSEFPGMIVHPDVKTEIVEGIAGNWSGNCKYLGNRWKD